MSDESTSGPAAGKPTELQQLEAALAAGVITPELFATLREKLEANAPSAPAPPAPTPQRVPSAPAEELPSLLDMFSRAPAPVEPPPPAPVPPVVRTPTPPPLASPPRPSAAEDAAARQRIEQQLAKLRQAPPAPAKPTAPPPSFYPEPPAPTFYPEPKPAPAVPPPAPITPPRAQAPPPRPPRPASEPASDGRTSASWLIILLIIGVLGGVAYYFTNSSHPDEDLTSSSLPAAETTPAAAPAPTSKKSKKHSRKSKRKAKAEQVPVSVASPDPDATEGVEETEAATASPTPAPSKAAALAGRPIPAVAEAGDNEEDTAVRAAMASYYADLYAPPLHASEHFAPQVERLYIRQNLTPAAIDAELNRSFFPDNQQAVCQIEPGTLRVSDPAADGSRTATFTEQMRLYRASLQKYQRLRTQVRVRFNADYKIVFMRQEKLLANAFEE